MKSFSVLAIAMCAVAFVSSCKSSESAYKKAYEKAQAQTQTQTATTVTAPAQEVQIAPVAQPTNDADVANEPVRREAYTLVSGNGLKAYSVICGSLTLKANAEGLQASLKQKGYDAQIVSSMVNGTKWFRVAAFTSDDKAEAVQSRNKLRATYKDAWLLLK